MKRKRFTEEQIIRVLNQDEAGAKTAMLTPEGERDDVTRASVGCAF